MIRVRLWQAVAGIRKNVAPAGSRERLRNLNIGPHIASSARNAERGMRTKQYCAEFLDEYSSLRNTERKSKLMAMAFNSRGDAHLGFQEYLVRLVSKSYTKWFPKWRTRLTAVNRSTVFFSCTYQHHICSLVVNVSCHVQGWEIVWARFGAQHDLFRGQDSVLCFRPIYLLFIIATVPSLSW